MNPKFKKYILFVAVILVGVLLDQATKYYASARLATQHPGSVDHPIVLRVHESDAGETLKTFLAEEFSSNSPEEIEIIARYHTTSADGRNLSPDDQVTPYHLIKVANRKVVVIPGYWDFQYTENPGAAFGLLSDGHKSWRVPFFIAVSLLAVIMILYILRGIMWDQRLMIWGLSLIASGAVGNFIDRLRFGYVIDFIVWKYTDAYRWPTFNIADALICVGVGLMLIELIRETFREVREDEASAQNSTPQQSEAS